MTGGSASGRYLPGVLRRLDPTASPSPTVFDIPRSGSDYPRSFRSPAPFDAVHRSISMYVEELYADAPAAGATWLFACFPNAWIDANRHEADIDPELLDGPWPETLAPTDKSRLGVGLIHKFCGRGDVPMHAGPLAVADVRERLERYYWPYHHELAALLSAHRAEFGVAFHISCHSMSSVGGSATADAGRRRSDFDIGDRHGETTEPAFRDLVVETLRGFGYDVTVNRHYAGAESIRKHGAPTAGVHSLQIEINRALYMDEEAFARGPDFEPIRANLASLAETVCAFARDRAERPT